MKWKGSKNFREQLAQARKDANKPNDFQKLMAVLININNNLYAISMNTKELIDMSKENREL